MAIEKIAVIGAGLMGHGIAQVAAMSGQEVTLIDTSDELLGNGLKRIEDSLHKLSDKGTLRESPGGVLRRIRTATQISAGAAGSGLVIEAVPEELSLKRKVFGELDRSAPPGAILATNTSGLSVTAIAEATGRRDKVIGMHWMNPPQVMKLIEVIRSEHTSEETLQTTLDLCRRYGKETVIARRDIWFFLATRARAGFSIEANLMYLRKEADFRELDAAARYRLGLPMGEFEYFDLTGAVDIRVKGLESLDEILKVHPGFEPWPAFLAAYRYLAGELWAPMRAKGLRGLKTGQGFYAYPGGRYVRQEIPEDLAGKVDPIQLLAPAVNVAAWCVTNGVGTLADVNKAFRLAFGWPKGIFDFLDDCGAEKLIGVLEEKEAKAPDWLKGLYRPDPLLTGWQR